MSRKSDPQTPERLSATEASRSFSTLLDQIEGGARFTIHRRGKEICVMHPPIVSERRASHCLALLRERDPVYLDDRFGEDLLEILRTEPAEERVAWDS